jgi:hypothetical protein
VGGDLQPATARPRRRAWWLILFVGAAVLVPLLYALYTGQIWEDYFITFKHSKNLCDGAGLVYYPGERVHGFTSPLGTLLPALCYLVAGQGSYLPALWLFRVLSAAAFAGGGWLVCNALRAGPAGRLAPILFAALYLLDVKAVAFSANGMETGFMLLFLGWALALSGQDLAQRWLAHGLCWAGLMWTRPDGCVYITVLAAANLVFPAVPRAALLRGLVKSAGVCAVVYLPWFAWAWAYYGSPVPNTIRAKAGLAPAGQTIAAAVQDVLTRYPERLADAFAPVYPREGPWPVWVTAASVGLAILCSLYWVLPTADRLGRRASLAFAVLGLYLASMRLCYPWYLPPPALLGLVVVAGAAPALVERWRAARRPLIAGCAAALVLVLGARAGLFGLVTRQMKAQQAEIEWGNRAQVGLWLRDHVAPGESVYVECLGYIGYFSEARMLDYPGLVSPEVVREMRHEPHDHPWVGLRLEPAWMVLRPAEARAISRDDAFRQHYTCAETFNVRDRIEGRYAELAGRRYLLFDSAFEVFRRVAEPAPSAGGVE